MVAGLVDPCLSQSSEAHFSARSVHSLAVAIGLFWFLGPVMTNIFIPMFAEHDTPAPPFVFIKTAVPRHKSRQ
jgi:hypothetical protein